MDQVTGYAEMISPLSYIHRLTIIINNMINSCVAVLLLWCSPPTVLWTIVSVVVYAVDCVPIAWWLTHVGKEIFKGSPTVADVDTAPTIVLVAFGVGIIAAGTHVTPNGVHAGFSHTVGATCLTGPIAMVAPTALGVPISQSLAFGHNLCSAVALA